jgi:hypothetical protein
MVRSATMKPSQFASVLIVLLLFLIVEVGGDEVGTTALVQWTRDAIRNRFVPQHTNSSFYAAYVIATWYRTTPPSANSDRIAASSLATVLGEPVWLDTTRHEIAMSVNAKIVPLPIPAAWTYADANGRWAVLLLTGRASDPVFAQPATAATTRTRVFPTSVRTRAGSTPNAFGLIAEQAKLHLDDDVTTYLATLRSDPRAYRAVYETWLQGELRQPSGLNADTGTGLRGGCVFDPTVVAQATRLAVGPSPVRRTILTLLLYRNMAVAPQGSLDDAAALLNAAGVRACTLHGASERYLVIRVPGGVDTKPGSIVVDDGRDVLLVVRQSDLVNFTPMRSALTTGATSYRDDRSRGALSVCKREQHLAAGAPCPRDNLIDEIRDRAEELDAILGDGSARPQS